MLATVKICQVCGQKLTDASGSWRMEVTGTGILTMDVGRDWTKNLCSWCEEDIRHAIEQVGVEHKKYRSEHGF